MAYPISWTVLLVCWLFFRDATFPLALVLIPTPWLIDFGVRLSGRPPQRSRVIRLFRWLNLLPFLPVFLAVLFFLALMLPSIARHNDPSDLARARARLGPAIKVEEVWYSQDSVFTGRPATYERIRFARDARDAVRARLRQTAIDEGCQPVPHAELGAPQSWFMEWDPASRGIEPYQCGGSDYDPGTFIDFANSGDSILIHYPGR